MLSSVRRARSNERGAARAGALLLSLMLPSCTPKYTNPFETSTQPVPPPASAAIVFSSNTYATRAGSGLELFSMDATGAEVTRLTFCNTADRRCEYLESIPGSNRARQAVRRLMDTDGDGRLSATDGESL